MRNVVPFDYQGQSVRFNTDGWINATDIAKRFGKKPAKWLELPRTKSYIAALARALRMSDVRKSDFGLVSSQRGGLLQGTWLHPKLAVAFARWLDDDFAVWCDLHIDALMRGELNAQQEFDKACRQLEDRRELASMQGRGLANWRHEKHSLEHRVDYWRNELQMSLTLDDSAA